MAKTGSNKPIVNTRRDEVRRTLPKDTFDWRTPLRKPSLYLAIANAFGFIVIASIIAIWTQQQPMARVGQIMLNTYAARVPFDILDPEATRIKREEARLTAPHVAQENNAYVQEIRASLQGLPKAVVGKTTLEEIAPELIERYELTIETVTALQHWVNEDGNVVDEWLILVDQFCTDEIQRHPLIDAAHWRTESLSPDATIDLILQDSSTASSLDTINANPGNLSSPPVTAHITNAFKDTNANSIRVHGDQLINVQAEYVRGSLMEMTQVFPVNVRDSITAKLMNDLQPTFRYDETATQRNQETAARQVPDQLRSFSEGEIIHKKGDQLTLNQLALLEAEKNQYPTRADKTILFAETSGTVGMVLLILLMMAGFIGMFNQHLINRPLRLFAVNLMMLASLALTVAISSILPNGIIAACLGLTLLLTIILVIAFNRVFALGIGALYSLLVCATLALPVTYLALLAGGLGLNVWHLNEIRDRNRLLQAGAITGVATAIGAAILTVLHRPIGAEGFFQCALVDVIGSAGASVFVGIFMLGILSSIERVFNVTTGLTLVELRDPSQPVLRELQQRAPGTWNHSLQVANLSEAAADAIGADSLLTYVGALYHDIGKMNKPIYFIENQSEGENRHSRLSPAMSQLIIVGHVKDGIEMAREFNLPKPLHHFIEAHHGTTLVEFFYHAAKEKADAGETNDAVEEVTYRYPGPKPFRKEVAILMIADAVESASRTLKEKSPSRIEQLVRGIGKKRLLDGQFDRCDLTLKELHLIEESIIKSLNAMYHGRVAYPTDANEIEEKEAENNRKIKTA